MRTPLDRFFKNTVETEQRALMHLFGQLRIDEPAEVRELDREIGLEAVHLDHLFEVRTPSWHGLHHLEFQTKYRADVPRRITKYDQMAHLRYGLPIHSTLVLPFQKHAPASVPDSYLLQAGGLTISCQYRVIRLWELNPAEIFALNRPLLLPMVPLAGGGRADWNRAARQIIQSGNKSLADIFITLGGMRYDRSELEAMLETVIYEELLRPEWVRESSVVAPYIERAEREGLSEGRNQEARHMLRMIVATRFPGLKIPDAVNALADPPAVEELAQAILLARSPAEAEAALRRAAEPPIKTSGS